MHRLFPLVLTSFGLLAPAASAAPQEPAPRGAPERRESRADSGTSRSSGGTSKTWRRVVKDGEVIEEEGALDPELERALGDSWRGGTCDPEKLLEELRRGLERDGFGELPPGFGELPPGFGGLPPGFGELPKGEKSSARSTHVRRVVVVNGETLVDEELRDGVPVRPSSGASVPPPGVHVRPLPGRADARAEARAEAHGSSSSSGSESSDSSGTYGDSAKRDARDEAGSKGRADGARPVLPDGSGRFRTGAPMGAKRLAPRALDVAPKPAPARASTSPAAGVVR
jgi:hypothetical protein